MLKTRLLICLMVFMGLQYMFSQATEIQGQIESSVNLENIHVINKNNKIYAITDKEGIFKIKVKLSDTLKFSSIQHITKYIIINKEIIEQKTITVNLKENVNYLDKVYVGKVLTGDLLSDIKNTEGNPPINFYDVGIPGYTGKIATQSERRLSEAGEFKPKMLLGALAMSVPINPIINGISGRTKMLKTRVKIEEKETLILSIKNRLSKDFLVSNPLDKDLVVDFFYFCADDEGFIKHCKNQTDFKILIFLRMKYKQYIENINSTKD